MRGGAAAGPPPTSPRAGMVLLATLMLVAVSAVAIAAATYVAAQAALVARARADAVRAHLAAESAVRQAAASWRATGERAFPLLAERPLPGTLALPGGGEGRATVRRLGGDLYLLTGAGRAGVARARAAALVRVLALRSFLADFPGGLVAAGVRTGTSARLQALAPNDPPPPWPAAVCDPGTADSLVALFGTAAPPAVADAAPSPLGLGPIPWDRLPDWADRVESGSVTPAPAERDGLCDTAAPANWGAPLDPGSPCAAFFPLVFAPGDLQVAGGSGQGVLVVRGDLALEGSFRFFGAIVVGGQLRADPGTEVTGAVRAGSASWAGALAFSGCALVRALAAAPALGRPLRPGSRWWLPLR